MFVKVRLEQLLKIMRMPKLVLLVALLVFQLSLVYARDFYAIAHMTNNPLSITTAVQYGANGLEMDLNFADDGTPTQFFHGFPCDCVCFCFVFTFFTLLLLQNLVDLRS